LLKFSATETLDIPVNGTLREAENYLLQTRRMVEHMVHPTSIKHLGGDRWRIRMKPIGALGFVLQPLIELEIRSVGSASSKDAPRSVHMRSLRHQIIDDAWLADKIDFSFEGVLQAMGSEQYPQYQGRADLWITFPLPPFLQMTPFSVVEAAGSSIVHGVLSRIKRILLTDLVKDYDRWRLERAQQLQPGEGHGHV
jgi:Protein of unknown function (DUF1997)